MSKSVKKKILDAIAYVRKDMGYTLVCEDWGDPAHKCACAISCVLLQDNPNNPAGIAHNTHGAASILGVSELWIGCFIEGYDCNGTADQSNIPEAWRIGNEVNKETKPIIYHEWDGENDG